jgi:hypothetical protein
MYGNIISGCNFESYFGWSCNLFDQLHSPSQKLAGSFISTHNPSNSTYSYKCLCISFQYYVIFGWKKSGKYESPGHTYP